MKNAILQFYEGGGALSSYRLDHNQNMIYLTSFAFLDTDYSQDNSQRAYYFIILRWGLILGKPINLPDTCYITNLFSKLNFSIISVQVGFLEGANPKIYGNRRGL